MNRRHSDYEPLALPTELLRHCRPGHPSGRGKRADQSPDRESNPRPSPYHGDALPTELSGRYRTPEGVLCNGESGYTATATAGNPVTDVSEGPDAGPTGSWSGGRHGTRGREHADARRSAVRVIHTAIRMVIAAVTVLSVDL